MRNCNRTCCVEINRWAVCGPVCVFVTCRKKYIEDDFLPRVAALDPQDDKPLEGPELRARCVGGRIGRVRRTFIWDLLPRCGRDGVCVRSLWYCCCARS